MRLNWTRTKVASAAVTTFVMAGCGGQETLDRRAAALGGGEDSQTASGENAIESTVETNTGDDGDGSPEALMDVVKEDFAQLMRSKNLSEGDKRKLENHFQLVRELEVKMRNRPIPVCKIANREDLVEYSSEVERNDRLIDIMFEAIRCDMSRVYTMCQFAGNGRGFHGFDTHGLSHANREGARANQVTATQAIAKQIGRFLTLMDSAVEDTESGRTYLDNTLVVWTSNMGSNQNHNWLQKFIVLFGGSGVIQQGKMLDYRGTAVARHAFGPEARPGSLPTNC